MATTRQKKCAGHREEFNYRATASFDRWSRYRCLRRLLEPSGYRTVDELVNETAGKIPVPPGDATEKPFRGHPAGANAANGALPREDPAIDAPASASVPSDTLVVTSVMDMSLLVLSVSCHDDGTCSQYS